MYHASRQCLSYQLAIFMCFDEDCEIAVIIECMMKFKQHRSYSFTESESSCSMRCYTTQQIFFVGQNFCRTMIHCITTIFCRLNFRSKQFHQMSWRWLQGNASGMLTQARPTNMNFPVNSESLSYSQRAHHTSNDASCEDGSSNCLWILYTS